MSLEIVERDAIKELIRKNFVVIGVGGGEIPVIRNKWVIWKELLLSLMKIRHLAFLPLKLAQTYSLFPPQLTGLT